MSSEKWNLSPQARKNKIDPSRKKFFVFPEMELSDSRIRKFLIFSQNQLFLYPSSPCTFWPQPLKACSEEISYIFWKKPPIFWKQKHKKMLICQDNEFSYASGSTFLRSKTFYIFCYKEAKFFKLKYFLIIIIWHFFSFYNIFLYSGSFCFSSSERFL